MQPVHPRKPLALPRRPEARAPFVLPVLATLAPVVVSGAVFVVTQSPLALVFAALGPVIAIGSLVDARVQSRRTARREAARFARETLLARAAIRAAHDAERAALAVLHPTVAAALEQPGCGLLPRWGAAGAVEVVLGSGRIASSIAVAGAPADVIEPDEFDAALDELSSEAAVLSGAPIVADAADGIGLVGPEPLISAAARAIVAHLVSLVPPADHSIAITGGAGSWDWLDALPLRVTRTTAERCGTSPAAGTPLLEVVISGEEHSLRVVAAAERAMIPGSLAVILTLGGGGVSAGSTVEARRGGRVERAPIVPTLLSVEQARAWATVLSAAAHSQGIGSNDAVPDSVAFADLALEADALEADTRAADTAVDSGVPGLRAALARDARGPVVVDLVADGPHAIVGGTTGSGKSELLISWVLSVARKHAPELVTFLLVDFKGGSSFGALASLPHCVGVLTDLDEAMAARALESLAAELRHRERALADLGARSIDDTTAHGALPRLVIVVDEFAAMAAGFPELHALFGDIAARGRSLGVHLVLCTQRPAGVIRDAVLANSSIRISLRVHTSADSAAVVGTDDAARLPAAARGRAVISVAGEPPRTVQVPLASRADVMAVVARWTGSADEPARSIRRPWLDPLPVRIDPASVPRTTGQLVFGLADHPAEQRQPPAVYDPARHGNLLVVGGSGSGRSTALAAIALGGVAEWLPTAPDDVWDAVSAALEDARKGARTPGPTVGPGERVLLLDDLDVVIARMQVDHRAEFVERLAALLREGPASSITTVVAVQRLAGQLQSIATLCGSRLVLALPDRQEHVFSGGDPAGFRVNAPVGSGWWQGHAVQVLFATTPGPALPRQRSAGLPAGPLVAVSTRPQQLAARLESAGWTAVPVAGGTDPRALSLGDPAALGDPAVSSGAAVSRGTAPVVLVADPATWQSHFGAIGALRQSHAILLDGCSVAEFRAVTGCRDLPPPTTSTPGACWLLEPDGSLGRVVL